MPSRKRKASEELLEPDEPDTSIDPYEELGLEQNATEEDVKKAYRKAALKHHPDKVAPEAKDQAKEAFQRIAFAYAILSDPRRRTRYDMTGSTSEVLLDADDDFDWLSFYREQFSNVINEEVINSFSKTYKESAEERRAVISAYKKYKGNLDGVYESVMLSNVLEDDERIRIMIDEEIELGNVPAFDAYTKETDKSKEKRIKRAQREAEEAEEAAKELKEKQKGKNKKSKKSASGGGEADLMAMIQARQKERGSAFLDNLEAKYASPKSSRKGKKKGRTMDSEPSEEAFEAMGKRSKTSK